MLESLAGNNVDLTLEGIIKIPLSKLWSTFKTRGGFFGVKRQV